MTLFREPPKEPPRKRGKRKPQVAFRPPDDLLEMLEGAHAKGYEKTEVIVRLMRIGKDASDRVGDLWRAVEDYARERHISEGAALAEMAIHGRECLEREAHAKKSTKK